MLPKQWTNHFLFSKLPEIKAYAIEQCKLKISGEYGHQEECYPWSKGYSDPEDDAEGYVFNDKKTDVSIGIKDTEIFIDAVMDHNHIWDLRM